METYLCDFCGEIVPKSNLEHHFGKHTDNKPLTCERCSAIFFHEESLKDHLKTHVVQVSKVSIPPSPSVKENSISSSPKTTNVLFIPNNKQIPALYIEVSLPTLQGPDASASDQAPRVVKLISVGRRIIPEHKTITHCSNQTRVNKPSLPVQQVYLCEICGQQFKRLSTLKLHQLNHGDKKLFPCSLCGKGFNQFSHYTNHMNSHTGNKPYMCDICGKRFTHWSSLYIHRPRHSAPPRPKLSERKIYPCIVCKRKFASKQNLKHHHRSHVLDPPYSCSSCSKTFNYRKTMKSHVCVKNSEKKAFSCKSCTAVFVGMAPLKEHYAEAHKSERTLACHLCPKKFYNDFQLRMHFATHSKQRNVQCDVCKKMFKDHSGLRVHQRIHTGEKPYECDVCGKRFSQSGSRNSHLLIHENKKPYACNYCEKAFRQSNALTKHRRTIHSDKLEATDEDQTPSLEKKGTRRSSRNTSPKKRKC